MAGRVASEVIDPSVAAMLPLTTSTGRRLPRDDVGGDCTLDSANWYWVRFCCNANLPTSSEDQTGAHGLAGSLHETFLQPRGGLVGDHRDPVARAANRDQHVIHGVGTGCSISTVRSANTTSVRRLHAGQIARDSSPRFQIFIRAAHSLDARSASADSRGTVPVPL
jgi:hypothetical protein